MTESHDQTDDARALRNLPILVWGQAVLGAQMPWEAVNLAMIPFLTLAAAGLIWLLLTERTVRA